MLTRQALDKEPAQRPAAYPLALGRIEQPLPFNLGARIFKEFAVVNSGRTGRLAS